MEAESSTSTISSLPGPGVPNVNGNIEEHNPAVFTITGPVHYVIQPAYDFIRGQGAGNGASRSTSRLHGMDIEEMQVVFTFKNPSQGPPEANPIRPQQNYDHIIDIPDNEIRRLERMTRMYHAAANGDLIAANKILGEGQERSELLNSSVLSTTNETALHIAAGARQFEFVEMLLNEPCIDDLINARDVQRNTALCTAAAAGASEIVKQLWNRRPELLWTPGGDNMTPAYIAATFGHGAIALELYKERMDRGHPMGDEEKIDLFFTCIHNDVFDLALRLLGDFPHLKLDCRRDFNSETALHVLAQKPSAFSSEPPRGIWNQLVFRCRNFRSSSNARGMQIKHFDFLEKLLSRLSRRDRNVFEDVIRKPRHVLFEAAAFGNYDFLAKLIRSFPDLIWEKDGEGRLIFHTAILKRHMNVFELIHETGLLKAVLQVWEDDITGDSILHFAAKLPPKNILNSVPGEALQMQKEILLFKELERFVPALRRNQRNHEGKTPKQVFTTEHEQLLKKGEEWMKKNANSCLLVATLIVTIAFPTAFTIPDGNNNVSYNHRKEVLSILSVTNAIAMGSSTISIITFFSILISRYAEEDFISSLPYKFKIGLVSLIVSLVTMMVSFCIATFVAYAPHGSIGSYSIIISAQVVAIISVIVFLVYPLLRDISHSMSLV